MRVKTRDEVNPATCALEPGREGERCAYAIEWLQERLQNAGHRKPTTTKQVSERGHANAQAYAVARREENDLEKYRWELEAGTPS